MIKYVEKYKCLLGILLCCGIVVLTMPIVAGSAYTYLCEDDFSFEGGAQDLYVKYGSSVEGAWVRTWEYYNTNQGTYLFTFLIHVIRAFSRGGLPGLHLYMVAQSILFIIALMAMICSMIEDKIAGLGISLAAFLVIFGMNGTMEGREMFFWYTGSLNYTLELSLSFISVSMLVMYSKVEESLSKKIMVLSCALAFLVSGGSLNVVAANCAFLAAVVICGALNNDKNIKSVVRMLYPFAFSLVGAIINVAAPGNYKRADEVAVEGHNTLFDALRDTFVTCISEDRKFFSSLTFILAMIFVLVLCLSFRVKLIRSKVSLARLFVILVGTIATRYFTMFPVSYGYHSDQLISMRTAFSYEVVAKLMYLLFVIVLSQFIWERIEERKTNASRMCAIMLVLVMIGSTIVGYGRVKYELKDGMSYNIINDFKTGAMQETYAAREYVLSSLQLSSKEEDVFLTIPHFKMANSAYGMGITSDSNAFVNTAAAGLFGLNSTAIIYEE